MLTFVFSVLLSVVSYLAATNQVLNFLEQREAVNLVLQVTMAVGALVTLIVSADAISGERERGTLEALLLAPVSRRGIAFGKLTAAMTLWLAAWIVSLPYIWVLGRGVAVAGQAVLLELVAGSLLALSLATFGLLVSTLANSSRVSVAVSIFLLVALSAPTQLPTGLAQTWIGDALLRVNPVGSALHFVASVLVKGRNWNRDVSYLAAPLGIALLLGGLLIIAAGRLVRLTAGAGQR
jgi:ABC-2 type transport system permease protein